MPSRSSTVMHRILPLLALLASASAPAATITVGNGGCQYIGLQFALDALESQPGPHTIKLKTQTIAIPNGLVLDTSNTSYTFIGGHANCSDAQPTPGQLTVLDATGGDAGTAFAINGTSSSTTPTIALRGLVIRGGSPETGPFANPEGGGLEIRGRVLVRLDAGTSVEDNTSGRGGGVYLRGDNASELATLHLLGDAFVGFNAASVSGGGVHCEDHGRIWLDRGQVSGNTTTEDGGGISLRNSCLLDSIVQAPGFAGLVGNTAGAFGGGIYMEGTGTVVLRGTPTMPFWISSNRARAGGGAELWNTAGTTTDVDFTSVVLYDNEAELSGAAITLSGPVALTMAPAAGAATCSYLGVAYGACSAIVGNHHDAGATLSSAVLLNSGSGGGGSLTLDRTLVAGNDAHNVVGAPYETSGIAVTISSSVFAGNTLRAPAFSSPSALVHLNANSVTTPLQIRHTTMTGNTVAGGVGHMLHYRNRPVDLTGAVLHNPGLLGRTQLSTATVTHRGCLVTSDNVFASAEPGYVAITANPQLGAGLVPGPTSPALDRCASAGTPTIDFNGRPRRVDQPGIGNLWGPVDIGAMERPEDDDVIFANGFQ